MNKQSVKVIKRSEGASKEKAAVRKKPKKKRSIENTIGDWITQRRENVDLENRLSESELAFWNPEPR